jgi:ribonuclease HII
MKNLKNLEKKGFKYVCGVDEAGRGPLAGPLSLSFFVISIKDHDKVLKPLLKLGLNDSKQIKEERREELYKKILSLTSSQRNSTPPHVVPEILSTKIIRDPDNKSSRPRLKAGATLVAYFNSMISAEQIDKYGIAKCYRILIQRLLKKVKSTSDVDLEKVYFLLDGSIKFPEEINHDVIIKGDSIEPTIMAASIVSKVKRDRKMKVLAKQYPKYDLDVHKGYGTKKHREAIKKFGLSREHRKSFCGRLTK